MRWLRGIEAQTAQKGFGCQRGLCHFIVYGQGKCARTRRVPPPEGLPSGGGARRGGGC